MAKATSIAHPNIALIKYWGNRDDTLRLPSNGSISMTLADLETRTRVEWHPEGVDSLTINGGEVTGDGLKRASEFLDLVRQMAGFNLRAEVTSENNFPTGAGIASSSSAFAALAMAATCAAGLELTEAELSRLARRGSGSACRSIPGGFVEWTAGTSDLDSFAFTLASPDYWSLVDCIAIINDAHKDIGSTLGHALASTSPLQSSRLADSSRRLSLCREAILTRDFEALAEIAELDSTLMHAVMMTSTPPLFYWGESTLPIVKLIRESRSHGLPAFTTIDAGPNVHVICNQGALPEVLDLLRQIPHILEVKTCGVGGPTHSIEAN